MSLPKFGGDRQQFLCVIAVSGATSTLGLNGLSSSLNGSFAVQSRRE